LNPFGEAFRRNGFRFPSVGGSEDSDSAVQGRLQLGQDEHKQHFPRSVWPSSIPATVPLSLVAFGALSYSPPGSDLAKSTRSNFAWNDFIRTVSLVAAGSFSDRLTFYTKLSAAANGARIDAAYLVWNDLIGPRHLVNLWIGRLQAPQLTSHSYGESYVYYRALPSVSVAGLFNANNPFVLGGGPSDGAEVNGVAAHRIAYSLGWVASTAQAGLASTPNAEDVYFHVGAKFGGMSLDGEGLRGMTLANPVKPWAETSITFDTFGYRGVTMADNYTNAPALTAQRSAVAAVGHAIHLSLESFLLNASIQYQSHYRPYAGSYPTPAAPPVRPFSIPGVPDNHKGRGVVGVAELAYVLYPWLIPAVRAEYTVLDSYWGRSSLLRVMPGVSVLLRPNVRCYVAGDLQRAFKLPPVAAGYPSWWSAAGGSVSPSGGEASKTSLEKIDAVISWAL
jgi:hypothetical protein